MMLWLMLGMWMGRRKEGGKELSYLTIDSTHLRLYGVRHKIMVKVREETCCHHYMGYSF